MIQGSRAGAMVIAAATVVAPGAALAQSPAARADALYDEAVALMDAGRNAEACPKLVESQKLDPAPGTLLGLARCWENAGKLATAWSAYQDAEVSARKAGQRDREEAARQQAALLLPRLPRLLIELSPGVADLPGLVVVRDGVESSAAVAGTASPVDPGEHVVEVRATGKRPTRRSVTVAEAMVVRVAVVSLEDAPEDGESAGPPVGPEAPPSSGLTSMRVGALVVGGAGVVAMGVGTAFGIVAGTRSDDADALCAPFAAGDRGTDADYAACVDASDRAGAAADVGTAFFIAGAAVVAVGVVLFAVGADDAGVDPATASLVVGPGGAMARGRF